MASNNPENIANEVFDDTPEIKEVDSEEESTNSTEEEESSEEEEK